MAEGSKPSEHSTKGLRQFIDRAKEIKTSRNRGNKDAVLRAKIESDKESTDLRLEKARTELSIAEQNSMKDHLTGLYNRRWFSEELARRIQEAKRQNKSLWIIYADIDWFKKVNDEFGHPVGDKMLKAFGEIGSREEEPISRIGGEEFAQIIPDDLDLESIQKILGRYSSEFKKQSLQTIGREVSLSFGIARSDMNDSAESIKIKADKALYHSKNTGRDKASINTGTLKSPQFEHVAFITEGGQRIASSA